MAGTCDNVELLLLGQVDELDRVAGDTDGEVGVLLLLGVLHGVQQLFHAKDVDVQVVGTLVKVAVHDLHQVGDALVLAVAQRIGVDGLGVGDAVQCPVIRQLGNGVQGRQQAVGLGAVARVAAGGKRSICLAAVGHSAGGLAVDNIGGDGQDGGGSLGVAVGVAALDLLEEAAQQLDGDVIGAVIIVAVLREVALDLVIGDEALLVADDLDLGNENNTDITPRENRAFMIATGILILMIIGLFAALYPEDSLLRAPNGEIASFQAPIMQSIVAVIFIFAAAVRLVYGILCGKFRSPKDVTAAMEEITKTLVQMVVFYFFAAQFLYAFGASNIGVLLAVSGAEFLKSLALPPQITILGIIIFVGLLNLIITSASAKWAILAPIFVPMLMAVGIAPELTQAAYRVSDSAVNVVTPMFAFYPLIILYCQKYVKEAGIGTLSSMMLPYTITLLVALTFMLYFFWWFDIPLGFQADYVYPRQLF